MQEEDLENTFSNAPVSERPTEFSRLLRTLPIGWWIGNAQDFVYRKLFGEFYSAFVTCFF